MAQKGFEVAATDISKHALKIAKHKAKQAKAEIGFVLASFVKLPFRNSVFDFAFDMGCFHHVEAEDRKEFITGLHRVLKPEAQYQLTCFSDRNGPAWNHFTKEQLAHYFTGEFRFNSLVHFGSVEADNYTRFFHTVLMQSRKKPSKQIAK
jgi:ubiquinone/menaquinone biosynthesis C-methylase UbiE